MYRIILPWLLEFFGIYRGVRITSWVNYSPT